MSDDIYRPPLRALCRHCGKPIEIGSIGTYWMDADGWTYCKKDLPHQPMPDGMAGGIELAGEVCDG